jgi:hypothetical protein
MDIGSIATAMVAASASQTQIAAAAKIMKMNAAAEASVATLLEAAAQNAAKLAEGIGGTLDVTV